MGAAGAVRPGAGGDWRRRARAPPAVSRRRLDRDDVGGRRAGRTLRLPSRLSMAAVPLCVALPLLASAASPTWLAIGLLVLGGSLGAIDVTMNIHAVIVERASGRSMMSGFHGLFSVGGISGAACMTAALAAGASPVVATLCVVGVIAVAMTLAGPHLLAQAGKGDEPSFAVPHGIVLFIGALCFVAFLAEGAMLDWSAVFLASVHGMATAYAGLGYALFSLAMAIGRLLGDRASSQRLGGSTVIVLGGLCAAAGFALATSAPSWQSALAGFALIGIGCANIVPVLYTSVGRQSAVPEHVAVSAITTLGYAGILAGPAMIGFVACVQPVSGLRDAHDLAARRRGGRAFAVVQGWMTVSVRLMTNASWRSRKSTVDLGERLGPLGADRVPRVVDEDQVAVGHQRLVAAAHLRRMTLSSVPNSTSVGVARSRIRASSSASRSGPRRRPDQRALLRLDRRIRRRQAGRGVRGGHRAGARSLRVCPTAAAAPPGGSPPALPAPAPAPFRLLHRQPQRRPCRRTRSPSG